MLRLAIDADVDGRISRGLGRRLPEIDLMRVQDDLPKGTHDRQILEWAADQNRIVVTNDRATMTDFAFERLAAGQPVPGLILTNRSQSIGSAIEDILLISEVMSQDEIRNRVVVYLPLRD
jgi:predicted nuclease of predicted toxin-antitoxin system